MFRNKIKLFTILGFQVNADASWLILFLLLTWSLASGFFPFYFKELSTATYWWMGVFASLGLFLSIVFHELCHSLVARRFGIPMKGITLFIFGGVAEMNEEPPSAGSEFLMAFAGPFSSLVLGGICYLVYLILQGRSPEPVEAVLLYLAFTNVLLAAFNLLPAFPLDGGRVLRSILWRWKKNIQWATRISSGVGSAFGVVLIVYGLFSLLMGNLIGGVWLFLIGIFLRNAAGASYQQLLARQVLEGERIDRFMIPNPVTVSPSLTLGQLVRDYVYRYHFKMFPVVVGESPVGCITFDQVKQYSQQDWDRHTVGEISSRSSGDNTISPETHATEALSRMTQSGNTRLMVVQNDRLVGIVSLRDLLKFLSIKLNLEKEKTG